MDLEARIRRLEALRRPQQPLVIRKRGGMLNDGPQGYRDVVITSPSRRMPGQFKTRAHRE